MNYLDNRQKDFIAGIKQKIRQAQYEAMKSVNVQLINLYWEIGRSISEKQAESWGKSIVPALSKELQAEFPGIGGFSVTNLWSMAQFYAEYHDVENLQPLVGEISWSKHIVILNKCKDNLEREFYIKSARKFGWTKNVLIHQIENKTYEKFLLNQTNFEETLPENIKNMTIRKTTNKLNFSEINASQRRELNNRMQAQHSLRTAEPPANHDPLRGRTNIMNVQLATGLRKNPDSAYPALHLPACTGLCKFSPIRGCNCRFGRFADNH
jgi:predicted nuclease of restriction endonuclease-like (RecB) superfamily